MGYCIYKICSNNIDYFYIGSTKNFTNRKSQHKTDCNNENSKKHNYKVYQTIRDNGGWENWRMVIIDEVGDITKRQAEIQEEKWRVELQANLNSKKCYITEEQKKEHQKEYQKEYYEQNKDKLLEQNKEYKQQNKDKINEYQKEYKRQNRDKIAEYRKQNYEQNKDKILEQKKEYYEQNKDKILEQKKEYYEQNKDKIAERMKAYQQQNRDKIICQCGNEVSKCNLAKHKKSKKHQA